MNKRIPVFLFFIAALAFIFPQAAEASDPTMLRAILYKNPSPEKTRHLKEPNSTSSALNIVLSALSISPLPTVNDEKSLVPRRKFIALRTSQKSLNSGRCHDHLFEKASQTPLFITYAYVFPFAENRA